MRVLRENQYLRRALGSHETSGSSTSLVVFMLVAIVLMALSRLDHPLIRILRTNVGDVAAPALKAVMVPFAPVQSLTRRISDQLDLHDELARLREENQRLRGWEGRALELTRRNIELDRIAKVVPEPQLKFATARIIADAGGPFVRGAFIDAGEDQGFKTGYPVISVDGVLGRLVATGKRASRLLLLADLNSRIPVQIGKRGVRAVMIGDNGPLPKLAYLPNNSGIEAGDDVFTSGVGGLFPRGLRIGTVVDAGDTLRVEPAARIDQLDYVSILFFDPPGSELIDNEGQKPIARSGPRRKAVAVRERASE